MVATKQKAPAWTVARPDRNVIDVRMQVTDRKKWRQSFLLTADRHHDNPHTDQDLERRHLDEAVERGAGVLDFGDLFCAMQGRYDPRRSNMDNVRPEHKNGRYLDALVDTSVEFYSPYAKNWILSGRGNHEQSVLRNNESDLLERFAAGMNANGGGMLVGGYGGWVRFIAKRDRTTATLVLRYFHGSGGGGPVTKGSIGRQRQRSMFEGYDVYITGHIHQAEYEEDEREYLTRGGYRAIRRVYQLCTPTYKDEWGDGSEGWHVERGAGPRPLGGWWMDLEWVEEQKDGRSTARLVPTFTRTRQ